MKSIRLIPILIGIVALIIFTYATYFIIEEMINFMYKKELNESEIDNRLNQENLDFIKVMDSQKQIPIVEEKSENNIETHKDFSWCIENGGSEYLFDYNTLKTCLLENKVYKERCVNNDKYYVIGRPLIDSVGSDYLIKYKDSEKDVFECEYNFENGDFEIKNGYAQYILALEDDFLIFDQGTGPEPRLLIVYDLAKKEKVYENLYSKPISIEDNTISFWATTDDLVTKENCPRLEEMKRDGFGSIIETRVSLDLQNLIVEGLGEYQCIPLQ